MSSKPIKRILYLETLAMKQAALLRSLSAIQTLPPVTKRAIKEVVDQAAMIPHAQAERAKAAGRKILNGGT